VASWPVTCVRQWGCACGVEGAAYHALGVDVANVGSDTWGVLAHARSLYRRCGRTGRKADVVERELADSGVELQEQRQRLSDTSGGTEDGDLGRLQAYGQQLPCLNSAPEHHDAHCHADALAKQKQWHVPLALAGAKRTWRADDEKVRREAWEKACLAANMMATIGKRRL
jgi:hypothetical protein